MEEPNEVLTAWNTLPEEAAVAAILPCNGSRKWAEAMSAARPFTTPAAVYAQADDVWRRLPASDWQEAFATHPRIGEQHAARASARSVAWSRGEQSAAVLDDEIRAALLRGNAAYEARFGRVFLVCATGKSAAEMLQVLERRLRNDAQTELLEAAEQQRRITQLRLRKWMNLATAPCDDV